MMKLFMRTRPLFPNMDERINGCLAYQASAEAKHRDLNVPSTPPGELCQKLSADHWGITDGYHLLVVIDELSRYPEVVVVKGTDA